MGLLAEQRRFVAAVSSSRNRPRRKLRSRRTRNNHREPAQMEFESGEGGARSQHQRDNGAPVESSRILVDPAAKIQIVHLQDSPADHKVVANHDSGYRPKKSGVSAQPAENKCAVVGEQFPRHQRDAHEAGDDAAGAKADPARPQIRKIIRRRNHIGADVDIECRQQNRDAAKSRPPPANESG